MRDICINDIQGQDRRVTDNQKHLESGPLIEAHFGGHCRAIPSTGIVRPAQKSIEQEVPALREGGCHKKKKNIRRHVQKYRAHGKAADCQRKGAPFFPHGFCEVFEGKLTGGDKRQDRQEPPVAQELNEVDPDFGKYGDQHNPGQRQQADGCRADSRMDGMVSHHNPRNVIEKERIMPQNGNGYGGHEFVSIQRGEGNDEDYQKEKTALEPEITLLFDKNPRGSTSAEGNNKNAAQPPEGPLDNGGLHNNADDKKD